MNELPKKKKRGRGKRDKSWGERGKGRNGPCHLCGWGGKKKKRVLKKPKEQTGRWGEREKKRAAKSVKRRGEMGGKKKKEP